MMTCLAVALFMTWTLGMILTLKLEAAMACRPTWEHRDAEDVALDIVFAFLVWPIVAALLLFCRHQCDTANGEKEHRY